MKLSILIYVLLSSPSYAGTQVVISNHPGNGGRGTVRVRAFVKPHATVRLSSGQDFSSSERGLRSVDSNSGAESFVALSGPGTASSLWSLSVEREAVNSPDLARQIFTISPF